MTVVEHLQQDIEHIRVRFLDLVKQKNAVGMTAHLLGELSALLVSDVSGRRSDQLRNRMLLHVFRHIDADHRILAAEHGFRQRLGEFGLSDAGWTQKQERTDRTVRILQAHAAAPDRLCHRHDSFLLADDALVQDLFEMRETSGLASCDLLKRNLRPLGDRLRDIIPRDLAAPVPRALL